MHINVEPGRAVIAAVIDARRHPRFIRDFVRGRRQRGSWHSANRATAIRAAGLPRVSDPVSIRACSIGPSARRWSGFPARFPGFGFSRARACP